MRNPAAAWRPVVNHDGPLGPVAGLVVHVQQGNGSPFGWFNDPASQASSHFWISAAGHLEQYVDTSSAAWAEMAGNSRYLSVECEGFDTEPMTVFQVLALAMLIRWCHAVHNVNLALVDHGGLGVTTHAHYPSGAPDPAWGGHPCPGLIRTAQLSSVLGLAINGPTVYLKGQTMESLLDSQGRLTIIGAARDNGNLLVFTETAPGTWAVEDVTVGVHSENTADPRVYQVT